MPSKRPPTKLIGSEKKRRKTAATVEEIVFDTSAREDYLTGFHKRKLQRIKHAKEEAFKKEREEKIKARKLLREERKADLEKHVHDVNSIIRKATEGKEDDEIEDGSGGGETGSLGIIEATHRVDHEQEYLDEDRYTTVTVEAVDVTRDGLRTLTDEDENDNLETSRQNDNVIPQISGEGETRKGKRIWTKEYPGGQKKRKKQFRYESKAERKITRYKERSGNKLKAKSRKE